MPNLNEIVASLQEASNSVSKGADAARQNLIIAAEKAHELEVFMANLSEQTKDQNLKKFFSNSAYYLNQLHQFAQDHTEDVDAMHNLFKEAEQSAKATLVPIMEAFKPGEPSASGIDMSALQATLPALGLKVFAHSKHVYNEFPNMNREEKIAATAGMLLMFAGIGMLCAATFNPVTCPVIAGILVVGVGIMLCNYALKRIEAEKAAKAIPSPVAQSEQGIQEHLNSLKEKYGNQNKLSKQTMTFAPAPGDETKAKATPTPTPTPTLKHNPGLLEIIKENIFGKKD